jgi:hypothetical protein
MLGRIHTLRTQQPALPVPTKRDNAKLNIKVNKIPATLQFLNGFTTNGPPFICYKNELWTMEIILIINHEEEKAQI